MYQGKDETKYATLIPYNYQPPFVMVGRGTHPLMPGTIFVDKANPSPDPLKKMLWGFDADGNFGPGDFKRYFKRIPGRPIEVPYTVNSMDTAHLAQVKKGAAIREFLALYRNRGGAERAIQPEVGRDRSSLVAEIQKGFFPIDVKTSDGKPAKILYATPWAGKPGEVARVLVLYWPEKDEYSTHEEGMRGGYYSGHYFTSLSSALEDFEERTGIRPPEEVFRTKDLPG